MSCFRKEKNMPGKQINNKGVPLCYHCGKTHANMKKKLVAYGSSNGQDGDCEDFVCNKHENESVEYWGD